MTFEQIVTLVSLGITALGLITGFILQRDTKKIRDLERENKNLKSNLKKAMLCLKGFQELEKIQAKNQGMKWEDFRVPMRSGVEYFDKDFLYPSKFDVLFEKVQKYD